MVPVIFIAFILLWLIPGSRDFMCRRAKLKGLHGVLYYAFVCFVPIVTVFQGHDPNTYKSAILLAVGFFVCGAFLLFRKCGGGGNGFFYLFLLLAFPAMYYLNMTHITFRFGGYAAQYNAVIVVNLIGLLTEKKITLGIRKKKPPLGVKNFITLALIGISAHFLINEFTGKFGVFDSSGIQTIDYHLVVYQIFFYLAVLVLVSKFLIFESMENLLGNFPSVVYALVSVTLIAAAMFFSIQNSGDAMVYIIIVSLLFSSIFCNEAPVILPWALVSLITFFSHAFFDFTMIPGL